MSTYAWKIDLVNTESNTMEVSYTKDEKKTTLNLPIPPLGENVSEWIDRFAPRSRWATMPTDAIIVGSEGLGVIELDEPAPAPSPAPAPAPSSSLNEEYLRALIYQVLEEIRVAAL